MKAFNTPEKISVYTGEKGWHEVAQEDLRPATGADYLDVIFEEKLYKAYVNELLFTSYTWGLTPGDAFDKFCKDYPKIASEHGVQITEVQ